MTIKRYCDGIRFSAYKSALFWVLRELRQHYRDRDLQCTCYQELVEIVEKEIENVQGYK